MSRLVLAFLLVLAGYSVALADRVAFPAGPAPEPLCRTAIIAAERAQAIPSGLMAAIGRAESGRRDPQTGTSNPWPWTVNAEGQGSFYDTKAQAVAAVRAMQARGVRSIDVGCMQVNLMHHPDAFASLEQAFEPRINADYAGRFLRELYAQTNAWPQAVGLYHSATPELGAEYQRRVMAIWPEEQKLPPPAAPSPLANAWAATLNHTNMSMMTPIRRMEAARIIPLVASPGGSLPPGRSLDAYRAAPVMMAVRLPARLGG